jgi:hypothetical protein
MARTFLRNDSATKVASRAVGYQRGIILQVLGAGSVFFGPERNPLENTDANGMPTAGNLITSANGPVIFPFWEDDMWCRGSVVGVAVEVTPFTSYDKRSQIGAR